jgi:nitrogen regulatory protein PII
MRLVSANFQPFELDDLSATSSMRSCAPGIGIDPVAASTPADGGMVGIQHIAKSGRVGDGNMFVSPIGRAVRVRTGEIEKAAG